MHGFTKIVGREKSVVICLTKARHCTSVKHRFSLCPVGTKRKNKWRLPIDTRRCPHYTDKKAAKGEGFSESFLFFLQKDDQHKWQPFTIPTFQPLNVRFLVKIFAKK